MDSDYHGAPTLAHTAERQEALRRYHILDTAPEKNFDQVTRLVAQITDVPTALITLLDEERQWFKSCFGYDRRETDIEVSFCAHVVHERETMVVEDATKDERFQENPLVTEGRGWRFYAGAPLRTPEGVHVGTLCIVDYEPRVFDAAQRAVLEDLADMVVGQFELRSAEAQYRKLFQGNPQPTFIYDIDTLEVLDANSAAERTYGYDEHELRALALPDLVAPASLDDHTDRSTDRSAPFTARHRRRDGTHLSVEVREESLLYRGRQARVATMIDVADRTRGRQYERLVENMQEVVFETDLDGQATFLNASWEEVTGFPVEDALGDSLLHYVHPKDRVDSLQAFAPLLQRREDLFEHQTRFLTQDGRELPMQFRARLITRDGTPVGTVGTLTPLEHLDRREAPSGEAPSDQAPSDQAPSDQAPSDDAAADEEPASGNEQPLYAAAFETPHEAEPETESTTDVETERPSEPAGEEDQEAAPLQPEVSSAPEAPPAFTEEPVFDAEVDTLEEEPAADEEAADEEADRNEADWNETDALDEELFAGLEPAAPEDVLDQAEDAPAPTDEAPAPPPGEETLGEEPAFADEPGDEFSEDERWGSDEPFEEAPPTDEPLVPEAETHEEAPTEKAPTEEAEADTPKGSPAFDESEFGEPASSERSLSDNFPALETLAGDTPFADGETLDDVRRRLSTDPPELHASSLQFGEHLRTTLDELEPAARRKGLTMHRALPEHDASIEADPGALRLLVAALVNNAIASTDEGSITVSGRAAPSDAVRLRVVDTGADISKSLLNSLLNVDIGESEQADEEAHEQHLAFVHRLVNLMQGSVEMESQRGRGTVFTVTLPRDPAAPAAGEGAAGEGAAEEAAAPGGDGSEGWSAWDSSGADRAEIPAEETPVEEAPAEPGGEPSAEGEDADEAPWGTSDSIFSTSPDVDEAPVDDPDAFRSDPDSPFSF